MRLIFTMVAAFGLADSGHAQQATNTLEIAQEFLGRQVANNNASALQSGDASPKRQLRAQEAINAANIALLKRQVVDRTTQVSRGEQLAKNLYDSAASQAAASLSQSGQNLTNYVTAKRIDRVDQYFGPNARQTIKNEAIVGNNLGGISQEGINLANVAVANVSINSGAQAFPETAVQENFNTLSLAAKAVVRDINQTGVNVGNMLIADRVENVERVFGGTQIIENEIRVASPANLPSVIQQNGTNIANYVAAAHVENLTQISNGSQVVRNKVTLNDGSTIGRSALRSYGVAYTESSENIVNFTHVKVPKTSRSSGSKSTVSMKQQASVPQSGIRSGVVSQVGNAAVIER